MREIVFDTETTGFGAEEHRIIEFGAVELINRLPSGRTFQAFFNPERPIDPGAIRVHGITDEKVKHAPRFAEAVHNLLTFIGEDTLVAHNADFDMGFLAAEFTRAGLPTLTNPVVDTLQLARQRLPGQRHGLDALCRHYGIDLSARTYHGALLDAQLLADVYVELMGGLQSAMELGVDTSRTRQTQAAPVIDPGVVIMPTEAELAALQALRTRLKLPEWPV
jgi:DNA polymerase III subunit epsilon